jgi:protein-S-isoprenylcysteine O-methyltransferase Ste14
MMTMGWKWWSLVAFLVLVAAIVGLIFRHSLLARQPVLLAVQIAAFLLMIWARLTLGVRSFHATANPTEGGLITLGPYRLLRHPIYAAILYILIAALISFPSVINGLLFAIAVVALCVRILGEERLLRAKYAEYGAYSSRTKRVIPYVL